MGRHPKIEMPVYLELIQTVAAGADLLDDEARREVQQFVSLSQHPDGAFTDRAGAPDWYYSLFGFWLASALGLKEGLARLRLLVDGLVPANIPVPINRLAFLLIRQGLLPRKLKGCNAWLLLRKSHSRLSLSYRLFFFLLLMDASSQNGFWLNGLVRLGLRLYRPPIQAPASVLAALTVARQKLGLPVMSLQQQMVALFDGHSGFCAFAGVTQADLLSTGVCLFALQKSGFDLRLLAPACLDWVQGLFSQGAFLSGNGDSARDLEYTFYGLLALGCLVPVVQPPDLEPPLL